jgi:hypothetical protein
MKTPTWAVVIGILLMLFGGCGMLKNGYAIVTPDIMEMQEKVMDNVVENMEDADFDDEDGYSDEEDFDSDTLENGYSEGSDTLSQEINEDEADTSLLGNEEVSPTRRNQKRAKESLKIMKKSMQEIYRISPFHKKWMIIFGYIGVAVCGIYLMSGAFLVNRKIFAIRFVYFALVLSILFSLAQFLVLNSGTGTGIMGKMSSYGGIFSLSLDIVLLIVFAVIDKSNLFTMRKEQPKEDWENF